MQEKPVIAARNYRIPVVKLSMVRDGSVLSSRTTIKGSQEAADLCRSIIGQNDREEMMALIVDAKHKVVAVHSISVGSVSMSIVHPREVFKMAIISNGSALILAHNHPSGDPTPSREDIELTARLKQGGELLGIPILDHVIIGEEGRFYSFADSGSL